MKIRDLIKRDAGFQYVVEHTECMSSAGRRALLDSQYLTDPEQMEAEWQRLQHAAETVAHPADTHAYADLRHCYMQLHDLQGTLGSLATHTTLNEVELFELKNLAYLTGKATQAIATLGLSEVLPLPDLGDVFALLDPDRTGVVNFYIYDTYDARLTPLRSELRALQEHDGNPQRISELLCEQSELQMAVCARLSDSLALRHSDLAEAMEQMAYGDNLFARAELCRKWGLVRPHIGSHIAYKKLFNPRLRDRNTQLDLRYQPVDILVGSGTTLITGANMAGKTVLLKTLGTAQMMAQCGMFVPATEGTVAIVDDVVCSIGDEQNEMNGLSSYASEIIKISDIVGRSRSEQLLVLIDEPARTTNPVEGKALVQAIATLLQEKPSFSLITTHYGQLGLDCRRLRVRGFVEAMANMPLTPTNIGQFIDYSLTDDDADDVPHEALRIAEILGCDAELLSTAQTMVR